MPKVEYLRANHSAEEVNLSKPQVEEAEKEEMYGKKKRKKEDGAQVIHFNRTNNL